MLNNVDDLPEEIQSNLSEFTNSAKAAFGTNLQSVILFGSAAEGRLRKTSDVNILLVLDKFNRAQADKFRDPLRLAHAAINVSAMFVLNDELSQAADAFAVKFNDIVNRHRVLFGKDVFASISVSRSTSIERLRQVLLNIRLRLRERYVMVSLRPEQLPTIIADVAGPIRVSATAILKLEGLPNLTPKEALERIVSEMNPALKEHLRHISEAREQKLIDPQISEELLFALIDLVHLLQQRLDKLAVEGNRI